LLIVDIQRGGPSTGLPTKTEQSDLLHAMFGRHGEAPVPIVAAKTPSHCFEAAIEAARIALRYRTPVYLLSDGYLANGSEPWLLPDVDSLPDISVKFATEPNATGADGESTFWPYVRDPETLARPWAVPGTPGLEHRIGGLEKQDGVGTVAYEPANHETMVHARAAKVAGIARELPPAEADDPTGDAKVLMLGWGSTFAAITAGVKRVRRAGKPVAQLHLVHLNPFPPDLGEVLRSYEVVLVPENNLGHLTRLVRADFLVDAKLLSKVQGTPFRVGEIEEAILREIERLEPDSREPAAGGGVAVAGSGSAATGVAASAQNGKEAEK
jgi:2-oxoglutarate ferredoxin oxidoreductase subunit alpha